MTEGIDWQEPAPAEEVTAGETKKTRVINIPESDRYEYRMDGEVLEPGEYGPFDHDVTITATAVGGRALPRAISSVWRIRAE